MSIEKALIDELVAQSRSAKIAQHSLNVANNRIVRLENIERRFNDLNGRYQNLLKKCRDGDPKITSLYQKANCLLIELRRKKRVPGAIGNAQRELVVAVQEAYPHVDLIPF